MPRAEVRAVVARLLDRLAEAHGDRRYRQAANVIRGKGAGRPAVDDTRALELAEAVLRERGAPSRNAACVFVAKLTSLFHSVEAARARLMRKLRTKY